MGNLRENGEFFRDNPYVDLELAAVLHATPRLSYEIGQSERGKNSELSAKSQNVKSDF